MSNRKKMWELFAKMVELHVEEYTVPQYGDWPDDQMTSFTPEEIAMNMKRYLNRSSSNQRGEEDALLDCLKLAHYASELFWKKKGDHFNSDSFWEKKEDRKIKEGGLEQETVRKKLMQLSNTIVAP